MLSVAFSYWYAECLCAECCYGECRYAECCYCECRYAEYSYFECRYAEYAEYHYAECYVECRYAECRYFHQEFLTVTSPEAVAKTRFNASRPTKVIIHGFIDSGFVPWVKVNDSKSRGCIFSCVWPFYE